MKLAKVRITEFQSIQDSTAFEIGDVTCLVGKNEAGKTALLKALYRLNPIIEAHGEFDVTDDYPRRSMIEYENEVKAKLRDPAQVAQATYALESDDIAAVEEAFGPACLKDKKPIVTLSKGYANTRTFNSLEVDEKATLKHLVEATDLPRQLATKIIALETAKDALEVLDNAKETESTRKLIPILKNISEHGVAYVIYNDILQTRVPKFLYFDEYYQMKGQDNLDSLMQRVREDNLEEPDHPLMGLITLAGLDLEQLVEPGRTEALLAKLEAAESQLTQKVLPYWSQNQHIRLKFDIRQALPNDPEGMTAGTNIWGRVENTKYAVTTPLGARSKGFVWFFSFLAWYSQLRRKGENLILLLDEPGLSLHAKAQADLLRYFEEELKPHHQIIYTTHSPFMVDPAHFERVRIVQDLSIERNSDDLPDGKQGTRVITDVLEATPDSLFPLQGALGYEIHQTLFIGPNNLIVEGVSDLLYIQTMSAILQEKGEAGLSADWTITPVGGADKIPTFVALIGAQDLLKTAVLMDYQKKDQQKLQNLYKKKLLKQQQVLTYSEYVEGNEADIEDMFNLDFYIELVNGAYESSIAASDLPNKPPRIIRRIEEHLKKNPLPENAEFNHYRPARYFSDNIGSLTTKLNDLELTRFQKVFDALNALL